VLVESLGFESVCVFVMYFIVPVFDKGSVVQYCFF